MATSKITKTPEIKVTTADDVDSVSIHNGFPSDRLFQIDAVTNPNAIPYKAVQMIIHRNGNISITGQSTNGTWATIKTYS